MRGKVVVLVLLLFIPLGLTAVVLWAVYHIMLTVLGRRPLSSLLAFGCGIVVFYLGSRVTWRVARYLRR